MKKEKLPKNIIAFEYGVSWDNKPKDAVILVNTATKRGVSLEYKYNTEELYSVVTILLKNYGWSIEEGDLGKQIVF